jgi:hypothetical protein
MSVTPSFLSQPIPDHEDPLSSEQRSNIEIIREIPSEFDACKSYRRWVYSRTYGETKDADRSMRDCEPVTGQFDGSIVFTNGFIVKGSMSKADVN